MYWMLLVLCFVMYGNTMVNKYAMDDELVTLNNNRVAKGVEGIPAIFKEQYAQNIETNYEYRPIVLLTYALEYEAFGPDPAISHFINILLYVLTGFLLFYLLLMIFKNFHWILPLSAVVLFLIHPVHTEVVASLKSRDELLSFLFGLLALLAMIRAVERNKIWLVFVSLGFILIGMLSKKSAMTFLAAIPMTIWWMDLKGDKKKMILLFVGVIVASLVVGKFIIQGTIEPTPDMRRELLYFENPMAAMQMGFVDRIPMGFYTTWWYIKLLLLPHPLVFYYGYDMVEIAGWSNIIALSGMVVFPAAFGYCLWKIRSGNPLVWGGLFFFISISMFTNVVKPVVGIVAERFAYAASLGFAVVLVYLILKWTKVQFTDPERKLELTPIFKGVAILLIATCVVRVVMRNPVWYDHLTLYENDLQYLERSAKANALYSGTQAPKILQGTADNLEEVRRLTLERYFQALAVDSTYITTYNNIGTIYFAQYDFKEAEKYFAKALELDTAYVEAYYNYGYCFQKYFRSYDQIASTYLVYSDRHSEFAYNIDRNDVTAQFDSILRPYVTTEMVDQVFTMTTNTTFEQMMRLISIEETNVAQEYKNQLIKDIQANMGVLVENEFSANIGSVILPQVATLGIGVGLNQDTLEMIQLNLLRSYVYDGLVARYEVLAKENLDKAIYNMERSRELRTYYMPPNRGLLAMYVADEDYDNVHRICSEAIEMDELRETPDFWTTAAQSYVVNGDTLAALEIFQGWFESNEELIAKMVPEYERIKAEAELNMPFARASILEGLDQVYQERVRQSYVRIRAMNQNNVRVCNYMAELYFMMGDLENQKKYLDLGAQIAPRY